jgi:hypothetical protein
LLLGGRLLLHGLVGTCQHGKHTTGCKHACCFLTALAP